MWSWGTRFSKKNLARVYPFGLRFDSSNADPMDAWSHGIQVAAINMQGHDRAVWISKALFSKNGGCGYVKKPDSLLPGSPVTLDHESFKNLPPKLELKVKLPTALFVIETGKSPLSVSIVAPSHVNSYWFAFAGESSDGD